MINDTRNKWSNIVCKFEQTTKTFFNFISTEINKE